MPTTTKKMIVAVNLGECDTRKYEFLIPRLDGNDTDAFLGIDSGKSAEPTTTDFRSPEAAPPPSGLELPQPAEGNVTASAIAASTRRTHRRLIRFLSPPLLTLSSRAAARHPLFGSIPRLDGSR